MNADLHSDEARYQEARTLIQRYTQLLSEKDIDSWMSLLEDNFVIEFPFAPQGRPGRIEGKADLYPYIQGILNDIEFLSIPQQQIHLTLNPDIIVAEITCQARIIATGSTYNMRYVWIMRTKDGKLIHQRDYWNPLALREAMGALDASKQKSER
ncbi:MAG TPA: nuclear transport factor 2 family protein [Ktedonobacteraceae bacterium]|jgi:ketosteroid isomerase-like protein|nr:nuclear transport factor 2 family protein [Ktedonobacteraceae bacterium]